MIKLSLRLETILDMTPASVVADVGSDHGKLMIALYESGKVTHGYA
ncbi:MAG: SAM-dependent methyltransferase, partial [Bacilli bacterium]